MNLIHYRFGKSDHTRRNFDFIIKNVINYNKYKNCRIENKALMCIFALRTTLKHDVSQNRRWKRAVEERRAVNLSWIVEGPWKNVIRAHLDKDVPKEGVQTLPNNFNISADDLFLFCLLIEWLRPSHHTFLAHTTSPPPLEIDFQLRPCTLTYVPGATI